MDHDLRDGSWTKEEVRFSLSTLVCYQLSHLDRKLLFEGGATRDDEVPYGQTDRYPLQLIPRGLRQPWLRLAPRRSLALAFRHPLYFMTHRYHRRLNGLGSISRSASHCLFAARWSTSPWQWRPVYVFDLSILVIVHNIDSYHLIDGNRIIAGG